MTTTIWWLRRDLRLTDNQTLHAALAPAEQVIPLFIIDPTLLASPYVGEKRLAFLWANLRQLDHELQARGSRLIVRIGSPLTVLTEFLAESGASAIYAEADFSPYARRRDEAIQQTLPLQLISSLSLRHPNEVLKSNGAPYTVFTPYSRAWQALAPPDSLLPAPSRIITPTHLASDPLPTEPTLSPHLPFPPGEAEAQRRLQTFIEISIDDYAEQRDLMAMAGTSQLSPYLRFGLISARHMMTLAYQARAQATTDEARRGAQTWLNELIWREFYLAILYHFPHVRTRSFQPHFDQIIWNNDTAMFAAWCQGKTGYPVVDAAMRQLLQSGWMHNRARMIVASFLVKDLLIDWRWGERWFMQHLLDGDPAANNGGWQWTAGVGTDAAPYFRVFNPILQSQKFDPDGHYLRHWLPELAHVAAKFIHTPWQMDLAEQRRAACLIGMDYPQPIIDHALARQRVLAVYGAAKKSPSPPPLAQKARGDKRLPRPLGEGRGEGDKS